VTYLDATLASAYDPGAGAAIIPKGSTLPGASKWQVSNSLSYWSDGLFEPDYVLSDRYISSAPGALGSGTSQGNYNIVDARATFHLKQFEVSLFVDNLFNSHGVATATQTAGLPLQEYIIRPLTGGMTLDYRF